MATLERLGPAALRATIVTFRDAVHDHAAAINRLNVYPVPDGDTGTNMARTLDAVVEELEQAPEDMTATCRAISHGSLMGARGNSGVILSQILRGLAGEFERVTEAAADTVAGALLAAAKSAYKAVLKPVEGTILTVVREAAEAAGRAAEAGGTLALVLEAARAAGEETLRNTPELLPVLKAAGVVDAGGAGFLLFLDAALYVVAERPLPVPELLDDIGLDPLTFEKVAHRGDVSELRYEVMYFCELPDERIDDFKNGWGEIGDSIVVVGGDGTWNCHVHTDDIGASIEVALDLGGRPSKIRVTDLFAEVDEEHARREAALHGRSHAGAAGLPAVTTAVVAVTAGQGLIELFGQLGVQGLVTGGQTMNPSTSELLDAVEAVNAPQVVLLPNNKNIIPVAEHVNALTTKSVRVVPTRSMPEALAALIVYDPEADAATNAAAMTEVAAAVGTGEVTQAVRDSGGPAGSVRAGDWIGLAGGGDGIVSVATALLPAALALLDHLVGDGREIVTIIEGVGSDAGSTEAMRDWVEEQRPGVAVEVHRGDQPMYPYLFGVE